MKSEREWNKQWPARQHTRVSIVWIKMLEFLSKKVGGSQRQETVPFGKTIFDGGIHYPEFIPAVHEHSSRSILPFKISLLLYIGPFKQDAQSQWMEKIDSQRDIIGLNGSYAKIKFIPSFKSFPFIFRGERQPFMRRPEQVGTDLFFIPVGGI